MQKNKPYGNTLKERLLASAKDRLHNFLLADGAIRGVIMNGTRMVNEMRANHELGILETLVLGRAYIGAGLMAADLKSNDRISIKFDCSGPIKGLVVEANAFGEVRGFLKRVPIPLDKPLQSFDLAPFFGAGFLAVTKYLQDAKQPFTGQVMLEYGNIAKDLANFYLTSEQVPTAFNLIIKFDRQGQVTGAGGMFLQAMPQADDDLAVGLEERVTHLPSLGEVFTADNDPESLVFDSFKGYSPQFLANHRIEFMCHCNRQRVRSLLTLLPIDELKDIRDIGPFPLEIKCHYCNTAYHFTRKDIRQIYGQRYPNN
ncbi:MAG: Hsp33 family molecular chaperone HslO [Deltaproteobacteria bacterium]|jgi:molecular chaperone Hsp33|nr:Hsp33 family molecular chaperone HslO [Deltaproteobacteria bacterium]